MVSEDLIGSIGGGIVACSFPQIVRVIKLKRAYEISPFFTSLMLLGCIVWTVYGFSIKLLPTMVFSVINTAQVALLMILRYMYGKTQSQKASSDLIAGNTHHMTTSITDQQEID